eukprot:Awhi_evm1s11801
MLQICFAFLTLGVMFTEAAAPQPKKDIDKKDSQPKWLGLQNFKGGSLVSTKEGVILTMLDTDAITLFFTDRPYRKTRSTDTTVFTNIELSGYMDEAHSDPPNAALSVSVRCDDINSTDYVDIFVELNEGAAIREEATGKLKVAYNVNMLDQPPTPTNCIDLKKVFENLKEFSLDFVDTLNGALFIDNLPEPPQGYGYGCVNDETVQIKLFNTNVPCGFCLKTPCGPDDKICPDSVA